MTHDIDLIGYLDNLLSEAEAAHVRDHLATCHTCRTDLADMEKGLELFTRISRQYPGMLTSDITEADIRNADNFALSEWASLPAAVEKRLAEKSVYPFSEDRMSGYSETPDEMYLPGKGKTRDKESVCPVIKKIRGT